MKSRALLMALLALNLGACRKKHARPVERASADWDVGPDQTPQSVPWWAFWHMLNSTPSEPARHYDYDHRESVPPRPPPGMPSVSKPTPRYNTPASPTPRYNTPTPSPRYNRPSSSPPSSTPRYNSGGGNGGGTRYNSSRR